MMATLVGVWLLQNDQMAFSNVIPCCEFNDNEGSAKYEDAADADNNGKMKYINQTHSNRMKQTCR